MPLELDRHDLQLLALVQDNAQRPLSALAQAVHLSTAAVHRRLKRLNEGGVIQAVRAQVQPSAVGHPLTLIAAVEVESERVDLLDAMKRSFAAQPEVQQCYYVTGESDFILIFTVRDMDHYTQLTRQLFFTNNNVRKFKTFVTMSPVKVGLGVPIAPPN